jgi:diguanylate cyclase (GGDEF)-like protein/PAS domain S-box-containing protein
LRRKGIIVVAVPVLALAMSLGAITMANQRQEVQERDVQHRRAERYVARSLLIALLDAETGVRGYLLTGASGFLEPFRKANARIPSLLRSLDGLVAASPGEGEVVDEIRALAWRRLDILRRLQSGRSAREQERLLLKGQVIREQLRGEIDEFIEDENREIGVRLAESDRLERWSRGVVGISILFGLLGGLLAMWLFTRGIVRRVQRLERNAGHLARGEQLEDPLRGEDELGRVARAMGTARKLIEERERERDRFFTMSSDLLGILDLEGRMVRLNPAWHDVLGWESEQLLSKPLLDLVHPDDRDTTAAQTEHLRTSGTAVGFENRYRHRDGSYRWLLWAARVDEQTGLLYAAARDITARKRQEQDLEVQALGDELTGLRNRRGLHLLAQQQLRVAARTRQPMAMLFVDLDDMKGINDTFGHPEGDRALIDTAEILRTTLRGVDIIARLGGDEFCALLVDCPPEAAILVIDRLARAVDEHNQRAGRPFRLSLSMGTAQWEPGDQVDVEALIERADRAMYLDKAGRT